jgi:hypothetical protein
MSYSHIDGRVVGKPNQGANKKKPFEFESGTKVSFEPDAKFEAASGRRQRPVYLITKASKPKISIEFSSANEYKRWWAFLTGGAPPTRGASGTLSHVFTRPGVGTMSWAFFGCAFPAPGYDSSDSGVTHKVEIMLTDAHLDGVTVFQDTA